MILRRTLLLAIFAIPTFLSALQASEPSRVCVLTYNIHHGEGMDGKLDLNRIAAVIKHLDPDIVALQEVDKATNRSHGVDQAAELGILTGMHAAFGKAMDYAGGHYGEAILSKYPLTNVNVLALPSTEGCEPRCALAAQVRLGENGPEFVFVSTHLEHAKAPLRLRQSNKLNPFLVRANSLPMILAGDFNDVPDSPTIRVLQPNWTDASVKQPDPTSPSAPPKRKIDYVFFRPANAWRVVEQQVVNEPVASDHLPLLVVLEWSETNDSVAN
ncbi:endonuclease/exonuclease/phosphatase family protein [Novipirellula herctigrandis]